MVSGNEFDVIEERLVVGRTRDSVCWSVMGDAGESVGVLGGEATVIGASEEPCPQCGELCTRASTGNGWECRDCALLFSPLEETED